MSLVGYNYSGSRSLSKASGYVNVTTYWRVESPINTPLQLVIFMQSSDGKEYMVSNDVPELLWCQSNIWQPGTIVRVTSRDFNLQCESYPGWTSTFVYCSFTFSAIIEYNDGCTGQVAFADLKCS